MEYLAFLGIAAVFIMIYVINGIRENYRRRGYFIKKLRENHGKFSKKEYDPNQFDSIKRYFEEHREPFQLDNTTWNDLNMDAVFKMMDYTNSSAGQEYLYFRLRTMKLENEEFGQLEKLLSYLNEHEEERIKIQIIYATLGKTGKFSLYDYLNYLLELGKKSNFVHYVQIALFIPAIGLFWVKTSLGIVAVTALIVYNIVTYLKAKKEISPYLTSFSYIIRMLKTADEICKLKIPVLDEKKQDLAKLRGSFRSFVSRSAIVDSFKGDDGNPFTIIFDYIKMIFHVDLIFFNLLLREVQNKRNEIDRLVTILGKIESSIVIDYFRAALPYYCIPSIVDKENGLTITEAYHPGIEKPIPNSISAEGGVLITGSNASGKSTFLKSTALCTVLSQTIHTCPAKNYEAPFYRVYSSMALKDNLENGESYYIVETKSLKRIFDAASSSDTPILCFVDEVLRGTNTVERIAASTMILRAFREKEILCFAATHDVELTKLLEDDYDNYHFEEQFVGADIIFPYKIQKGHATTRNAIRLLDMLGFDESIVTKAANMAEKFLSDGVWENKR